MLLSFLIETRATNIRVNGRVKKGHMAEKTALCTICLFLSKSGFERCGDGIRGRARGERCLQCLYHVVAAVYTAPSSVGKSCCVRPGARERVSRERGTGGRERGGRRTLPCAWGTAPLSHSGPGSRGRLAPLWGAGRRPAGRGQDFFLLKLPALPSM